MSDAPVVAIVQVVDAIAPGSTIGARQAGLLCLPDGKARWRDFDPPSAAVMTRTLAGALRELHIGVVGDDDAIYGPASNPPRRIVRVTLVGAALALCRVKFGLKGDRVRGTLTVRWEEFDRATRTTVTSDDYAIAVDSKTASDGRAPLVNALTRSAVRWASERGGKPVQY